VKYSPILVGSLVAFSLDIAACADNGPPGASTIGSGGATSSVSNSSSSEAGSSSSASSSTPCDCPEGWVEERGHCERPCLGSFACAVDVCSLGNCVKREHGSFCDYYDALYERAKPIGVGTCTSERCNDYNECTQDTTDATGACVHVPVTDGSPCESGEGRCDKSGCCRHPG